MDLTKDLNDKEFSTLSKSEKVAYLNIHNYGEFREVKGIEYDLIVEYLAKKYPKETNDPYAIREETNDVVVRNNTQGMYGKLSPRLFYTLPDFLIKKEK